MPRPGFPPTPASSTDIKGKDGSSLLSALQLAFELPPPALHDAARTSPDDVRPPSPVRAAAAEAAAEAAPYRVQPSEAVKSRRRSSAVQKPARETFALPPPPTRSRKIIQMKPKAADEAADPARARAGSSSKTVAVASASTTSTTTTAATTTTASGASKRKQPSATSAAGRKVARKTAHSLIERRRRSKMNEEFAVLKGMIPACTGEMHKLAILQASIEYVRYLEDCVAKLKAQQASPPPSAETGIRTPSGRDHYAPNNQFSSAYPEDASGDVEMTGSALPSPAALIAHSAGSHQPSLSPVLLAEDSRHRHESYSSASTDHRHYSYSASSTTSPAFGPQQYHGFARGPTSGAASTDTSPALGPQRDLDQEATAALLMLNSDRRRAAGSGTDPRSRGAGRGMSVRDLLTT